MTRRHALVIGAQRSGSTLLRTLLSQHPQVAAAEPARPEPKVFLDDEVLSRGRDWYLATWFAHAPDAELLVEKSTTYLERPDAARRARRVLGEHDVVAILRDPVDRAVSNWRFSTAHGMEDRSLEHALTDALDGDAPPPSRSDISASPFAYLSRGHYDGLLTPWAAAYGDRLHVVLLADLVADPGVLDGLEHRLGLSPATGRATPGRINASADDDPPVPDELVRRLRDHFADSDAALAARLGRSLPWGGEAR